MPLENAFVYLFPLLLYWFSIVKGQARKTENLYSSLQYKYRLNSLLETLLVLKILHTKMKNDLSYK
jgi:hypothetical protein